MQRRLCTLSIRRAVSRDATDLVVTLPETKPNGYAYALKIMPK